MRRLKPVNAGSQKHVTEMLKNAVRSLNKVFAIVTSGSGENSMHGCCGRELHLWQCFRSLLISMKSAGTELKEAVDYKEYLVGISRVE